MAETEREEEEERERREEDRNEDPTVVSEAIFTTRCMLSVASAFFSLTRPFMNIL